MVCPKCKGYGNLITEKKVERKKRRDWEYGKIKCLTCEGKGYLLPEEAGLGKF